MLNVSRNNFGGNYSFYAIDLHILAAIVLHLCEQKGNFSGIEVLALSTVKQMETSLHYFFFFCFIIKLNDSHLIRKIGAEIVLINLQRTLKRSPFQRSNQARFGFGRLST